MKIELLKITGALGLCAMASPAWCYASGGVYDANAVVNESNVIIVARVARETTDASGAVDLSVEVERIAKGPVGHAQGESLRIRLSSDAAERISLGDYRLFLLQCERSSPSSCKASNDAASFPALPGAAVGGSPRFESIDAVLSELLSVMVAGDAELSHSLGRGGAPASLLADMRLQAMSPFFSLPRAKVVVALANTGTPSDSSAQLGIMGLRLAFGDVSTLDQITTLVTSPTDAAADSVELVARGLDFIRRPPNSAVPVLAKWLRAPSLSLRISVASALREIGTPEVVRPMLDVALNDPNPFVRCQAVQTLAAVTHLAEVVSADQYDKNEAKYLAFWKSRRAQLDASYK